MRDKMTDKELAVYWSRKYDSKMSLEAVIQGAIDWVRSECNESVAEVRRLRERNERLEAWCRSAESALIIHSPERTDAVLSVLRGLGVGE